jgi:hypothetical protein
MRTQKPATVNPMASPRAYSGRLREPGIRARRRRKARAWRIGLVLAGTAVVVAVLLAAFASPPPSFQASLPNDSGFLPTGRPAPLDIARQGALAIQLPIAQQAVTALGYHGVTDGALPLDPIGRQANESVFVRLFNKLTGAAKSGVTYYQLGGGSGPQTSALDVGGPAGVVVYAPVNGTVVSIRDYVLNGRPRAQQIDIVPSNAPSVVVSISRLRADPALTVGSPVQAQTSKIGVVMDLSQVEEQALADITHERGNHVTFEVHPAAALSLH